MYMYMQLRMYMLVHVYMPTAYSLHLYKFTCNEHKYMLVTAYTCNIIISIHMFCPHYVHTYMSFCKLLIHTYTHTHS